MRPVTRAEPQLPPHAMKTYQIAAPQASHYRPATCADVDCPAYAYGWATTVDETTELGQAQAHYIRQQAGRRFVESHPTEGLTAFEFEPGQRCFAEHEQALDRPALYIVREGDWRGNPRRTRPLLHTSPQAWVDDFGEHQERLADRLERG